MADNNVLSAEDLKSARILTKGNLYEDFSLGQVFDHHWGRTITQAENALFSSLTLHFNPMYFNAQHAAELGHADTVLNPLLVFNTVFGLSVEDLSEAGMGPFLGVTELSFHEPVYAGDTINAKSTVVDKRESDKRPEFGIVTWHTVGTKGDGATFVDYKRANLVTKREFANAGGA
ncbi:MAG: MaoC family dehydratase [Pseudomonadota bacterium]